MVYNPMDLIAHAAYNDPRLGATVLGQAALRQSNLPTPSYMPTDVKSALYVQSMAQNAAYNTRQTDVKAGGLLLLGLGLAAFLLLRRK